MKTNERRAPPLIWSRNAPSYVLFFPQATPANRMPNEGALRGKDTESYYSSGTGHLIQFWETDAVIGTGTSRKKTGV
jgi:hypothetical protein